MFEGTELKTQLYIFVSNHGRSVAYPGIFFGGGSTNSVEDRVDGDLGAVAP